MGHMGYMGYTGFTGHNGLHMLRMTYSLGLWLIAAGKTRVKRTRKGGKQCAHAVCVMTQLVSLKEGRRREDCPMLNCLTRTAL